MNRDDVANRLERALIAYWHDVDFNWGANAAAHYTQNGAFISPRARYDGRTQIAEFYAWRKERGARVNVHLVSNFWLKALTPDTAETDWICTLFAADGAAPQPSAPPVAISRVSDSYVRDAAGGWLCRERRWHTLFTGAISTTAMPADEMARRLAAKA